jgi:probable F420-dependent oxidoreductase
MPRPFQFIAGLRRVVDRATLVEHARTAEKLGFTHLCIHDHLEPQLAPIPMLTAVAMATERLRVCPLVLNNDLRHPAVLAQELATLDVISYGRLDVGIGAGWNEPEYRAIGLQFDPPGLRIERMTEAIAILRGLFADGPFSFSGRQYAITNLDGQPKPVQRPHPPFLVGGTRERVLRLAAREGDIVGIDLRQDRESLPDAWPDRMDTRVGWVRDEAGERFDSLDLSVLRILGPIAITPHAREAALRVADAYRASTGLELSPEDIIESPYSLIGTIPSLVDKLRRARDRWGINSYLLGWFDEPEVAHLEPLVEQLTGS